MKQLQAGFAMLFVLVSLATLSTFLVMGWNKLDFEQLMYAEYDKALQALDAATLLFNKVNEKFCAHFDELYLHSLQQPITYAVDFLKNNNVNFIYQPHMLRVEKSKSRARSLFIRLSLLSAHGIHHEMRWLLQEIFEKKKRHYVCDCYTFSTISK